MLKLQKNNRGVKMKDKGIRSILIEYLKITHKKYRIFQEKSIGSSICDLMLVTPDKLIGFEIKSDTDNYERLSRQVKEYEQFFEENYVVVGESHVKSIESKVPSEWGILAVNELKIVKVRDAEKNKKVDRARQLSILWKLELKNILIKNDMSLYAQKEKPYIISQIVENVDKMRLGKQITSELLTRDYSIFDAEDLTIRGDDDNESILPSQDIVDHLSELDLSTFTLDKWMSIYERAVSLQAMKEGKCTSLDKANEEVERALIKIPYTEIEVSLGAPWISAEIITQFAIEVLKANQQYYYKYDKYSRTHIPSEKIALVQYEPITGYWYVDKCKWQKNVEIYTIYGTQRYNAMQILEATLNLRNIKIYDGTKYNEIETIRAIEKQELLKDAFKNWVFKDEARIFEIEKAYNKMFAEYETPKYDGSDIEFKGMNPNITLFKYQKDAVKKIISTPNTLLAFDVGAGKTYIMIAAAMEMRESGLSRKNLFVVPNNIVGQWEKMFTDLYPHAKVLTIEPRSFTPEKRNKVLRQIQREDYDGIIMAYSCFDMIPLSEQYLLDDMHDEIEEYKARLQQIRGKNIVLNGCDTSIRREMKYTQKLINELISCVPQSTCELSFQELEINTIFLDEAHNFKNIPLRTNQDYLRGINTKGSKKCLEMLKKVQSIQVFNGGRGAVFATGTPLCNSISDTYTMQCYLQYDELKKKNLHRFDNWLKTFASLEEICEIDVNASTFRVVSRFRKFFNLVELSKMFSQITIFHNTSNDGLPEVLNYCDEVVEKSEALDEYMKELYKRTENVRNKVVGRREDNMLKISTDGRKAALSLNLVEREQVYDEKSKVYNCVKNVMQIYNSHEGATQLIFCDYSTPKMSKYNVYKELKERLVENGIPPKEIAFVHSCKNEEQKVKLYDDVNNGRVRVLIGSTFKLGIGANVQKRLKAIHHLDVPWRPADMVQREGRIMRRGNENREIEIYRYIVEGSFDSYSWQILQTKQHFISQFLSGSNTQRSIEDFDNDELNYAQVKALALSQPLMKNYVEKENELRSAKLVYRGELITKEKLRTENKENNKKIKELELTIKDAKANFEYINSSLDDILSKIPGAVEAIEKRLKQSKPNEELYSILEFNILAPNDESENKRFVYVERNNATYLLELGESEKGNTTRLKNFFLKFEDQIKAREERHKKLKLHKKDLEDQLSYKTDSKERIIRLENELKDIYNKIKDETNSDRP